MEYRQLGRTDITVSELCLGIMTFGEQNTEEQAHAQLDSAFAYGVNFVDTAEMYPFPTRAETSGESERILGTWLKSRANRDQVILATKVSGPAPGWLTWIRDGETRLDRKNIEAAIDASLRRLQTDYVDLYQLHWPQRNTNYFGQLGYTHDPADDDVPLEETLQVLTDLVASGKVRHIGISNETPWGTMRFCDLADWHSGMPRMVSIQNPYNLLNRTFEIGLAEVAHREQVGLLAYSPLAFGVLTGKYLGGQRPAGSRLALYPQYKRYATTPGETATTAYSRLAHDHGLSLAQVALAYILSRPFLTSCIITATTLDQLREDLESSELELSEEVLEGIEKIHETRPNPCP